LGVFDLYVMWRLGSPPSLHIHYFIFIANFISLFERGGGSMCLLWFSMLGRVLASRLIAIPYAFTSLALSAHAQSGREVAGDTVYAIAGIGPVLSLSCTDVDFGVWRVPQRNAVERTDITLSTTSNTGAATTNADASGWTQGVAQSAQNGNPSAGVCTVTGSQNPGQRIQVSISGNSNLALGAANRVRLPAPAQAAQGTFVRLDLVEETVLIDANGVGTFRVTGVLSIPRKITNENFGGYSTIAISNENSALITVIDQAIAGDIP
jgi:hypothetical protein